MRKNLVLAVMALIAISAVGGTIYKWVDEKGVTHYSESPPPGEQGQRVEIPSPVPAPTPESGVLPQKSWEQKDEEFKKRHRERQKELDRELSERQRAIELEQIQQGVGTPVPGQTGASRALQRNVLRWMVFMDTAKDDSCSNHRVLNTELLDSNRETGSVVERWTLDRCGTRVNYRVTFRGFGAELGRDFGIEAE